MSKNSILSGRRQIAKPIKPQAGNGAFSVEAGRIVAPTGWQMVEHIFPDDKGDYYQSDDGPPAAKGED